jgi:hypothetical protein
VAQPTVELARGFTVDSLALTEEFGSSFKLGDSGGHAFESANKRQQLHELVLVKLFGEQGLLLASILPGFFVVRTLCFSGNVHNASSCVVELISIKAF